MGGISDPKNYIADFVGYKAEYFGKKRNVISKKGGGGVKAVWKVSKKTSIFEPTVVPKSRNSHGGGAQQTINENDGIDYIQKKIPTHTQKIITLGRR